MQLVDCFHRPAKRHGTELERLAKWLSHAVALFLQ
jgi:hypothetical protein